MMVDDPYWMGVINYAIVLADRLEPEIEQCIKQDKDIVIADRLEEIAPLVKAQLSDEITEEMHQKALAILRDSWIYGDELPENDG